MNCKPGDLAIVVRSCAGNEGKIVTCVRFIPRQAFIRKDLTQFVVPAWEIDRDLIGWSGSADNLIPDENLFPIRPGDLQETTDERKEVLA